MCRKYVLRSCAVGRVRVMRPIAFVPVLATFELAAGHVASTARQERPQQQLPGTCEVLVGESIALGEEVSSSLGLDSVHRPSYQRVHTAWLVQIFGRNGNNLQASGHKLAVSAAVIDELVSRIACCPVKLTLSGAAAWVQPKVKAGVGNGIDRKVIAAVVVEANVRSCKEDVGNARGARSDEGSAPSESLVEDQGPEAIALVCDGYREHGRHRGFHRRPGVISNERCEASCLLHSPDVSLRVGGEKGTYLFLASCGSDAERRSTAIGIVGVQGVGSAKLEREREVLNGGKKRPHLCKEHLWSGYPDFVIDSDERVLRQEPVPERTGMQQLCARCFAEAANDDLDWLPWTRWFAQKERVAIDGLCGPTLRGRRVRSLELAVGKAVQVYALSPEGSRDAQGIRKSDRELHVEDLPSTYDLGIATVDAGFRPREALGRTSTNPRRLPYVVEVDNYNKN